MQRPRADEYGAYYHAYVQHVPDGDVLEQLARQGEETSRFLAAVPREREGFRYQEGKWSVRELVGHLVDCERIFSVRALAFARGDRAELPGFDENRYVAQADFDHRPLASLAEELRLVRGATLGFFRSVTKETEARRGVANGASFTVRSVPFILAGHELHHLGVLRERYL
jgi:uncharacterized damage-inducible protein DinB